MRQETQKIAKAFAKGERAKAARTETDGVHVWLHGNMIAKRYDGKVSMTLAGWNTNTTRDRLNGIAHAIGADVSFCQRNFAAVLRFKQDGEWQERKIAPREWVTVN